MFAIHDDVPLLSAMRDNEGVVQGFLGDIAEAQSPQRSQKCLLSGRAENALL
jgi:hypothetical protein